MGLVVSENTSSGNYEPIEAGTYQAVCVWVMDIGHQWSEYYEKESHKIMIHWEIPSLRIQKEGEDGFMHDLPRMISKRYTKSLHANAALRKDLEAWRGKPFSDEELKGFDLKNILGSNCLLQVVHRRYNDKVYDNVGTVTALMKDMKVCDPEGETVIYDINGDEPIPDVCPKWIRELIDKSTEMTGSTVIKKVEEVFANPPDDDDQIPF